MASSDDDIEKLLRDVEASLGGTTTPGATSSSGAVEKRRDTSPAKREGDGKDPLAEALVTAGIAGVVVALLFGLLPFVTALSGGLGAFVAVFLVTYVNARRGR